MKDLIDEILGPQTSDKETQANRERTDNGPAVIHDLPLELVDDFPDHPFQVRLDEDMDQLVESIRERGLITPITARPKEDGRYEIVSGHRRKKACELAGLSSIKAEVRELSRDEAIVLMVESNLQRSVILPSEKAFSYKMRLEAMKRLPGRPSKENVSPVGTNLRSDEILSSEVGDSRNQIQRFIRLTNLIPGLLQMVDEGKIAMRPAVEISYLSQKEQEWLLESIEYTDCTPSHAQTIRMRAMSKEGKLGRHVIENIMDEEKPNQAEKISLRYEEARKYIPSHVPYNETREYILKALRYYQESHPEKSEHGRGAR